MFNEDKIEMIKNKYPKGTKIKLISMNDSQAVPSGTIGIVDFVDDAGTIQMNWENGSSLGLIEGEDQFSIIEKEKDIKPKAKIIGADGNVFNLIGICSRALKDAGYPEKAKEMTDKVMSSGSYEEALCIMTDYIDPVDQNYNSFEDSNDFDYDDDISMGGF